MSEAKWRLMVDWEGDGQFAGADDDVTSAALRLSLRHMRDLESEYMEAARLDIRLANLSHQYSPPNSASKLFGKLKPGRKVWLAAAFPYDEFGGATGSALANRAPEFGKSYLWTTTRQGFRIAESGGAQTDGAGQGARIAVMDFGLADVSFGCDFTRADDITAHGGLTLRYSDADNFLYVCVTPDEVQVRKVEQGDDELIAQSALQWDADERRFVQVVLHGDLIRVFVNRRQLLMTQSGFNVTATRHGLYCGGAAAHTWQRFGGWASLFYGALHSIDPQPGEGECRIGAYDEMRRLESVTLYMYATSSFPQTSGEILADILDYAGVDAAFRMSDTGVQLVPQLWSPPLWGAQAADEIRRLQDEEDGFVYVDGHGFWRLEKREHRAAAPHATTSAVLRSRSDAGEASLSALEWSDGADNIENKLFMRIRDAVNHGHRTAWTLGEKPYFAAGQTREFLAESNNFDIVGGQLRPLPNIDYEANTQPDGTGTDITDQLAVSYPATRLYNGKGTLIRVSFGDAAGYLTRLGMRTVNALTFNAPLLITAEDADSQRAFGQRIRSIDARWTRETQRAQATLDSRMARKSAPRTALTATLLNGSDANMLLMLQLRLSDRVSVRYEDMGVNGDFFVEGHRLNVSGGNRVERRLLLQESGVAAK